MPTPTTPTTTTAARELTVGDLIRVLDAGLKGGEPGPDAGRQAMARQLDELVQHFSADTPVVILPLQQAIQGLAAAQTLARLS